jgi:hypothetical protein
MVAMGVGDDDMRHPLPLHSVEDRLDVGRVVRTGVDHRHLAHADDVRAGAMKGEGAGIARDHAADQRR